MQRGFLESERGADGKVYVRVDTGQTRHDERQDTGETAGQTGHDEVSAAKDETIELLREQLEAERAANRENRRLLAAALERMPELESVQHHEQGESHSHGSPQTSEGRIP